MYMCVCVCVCVCVCAFSRAPSTRAPQHYTDTALGIATKLTPPPRSPEIPAIPASRRGAQDAEGLWALVIATELTHPPALPALPALPARRRGALASGYWGYVPLLP